MTKVKNKTCTALLIKDAELSRVEVQLRDDSGAGHIQQLIGGYFGQCFSTLGAERRRNLIGFCDDDGLIKSPLAPWNILISPALYRGGWPIRGPVLVLAHVGARTVPMLEVELSSFFIGPTVGFAFQGEIVTIPILTFNPGYNP